jgi:peptidoglycan hydrolase-like protein with peptidoglycan-binding domain
VVQYEPGPERQHHQRGVNPQALSGHFLRLHRPASGSRAFIVTFSRVAGEFPLIPKSPSVWPLDANHFSELSLRLLGDCSANAMFRFCLDATSVLDVASSEKEDPTVKDLNAMGAVTHGSRNRLAKIGATVLAAGAIAAAGCAASTASASTASASTASAARPATAAALASTTARARAVVPAAYTPPSRTLSEGMSGSDVKALQRRLAALKYYPGAIDGQFGDDTLEAVWAFQEVNQVTVTGVIDAATKRALVHPKTYRAHYPKQDKTRVEVNLAVRVLVLYKDGKIELISHISSGGGYYYDCGGGVECKAVTPTGNYRTTVFMPGWVTVPLGQMYNPVFFISTVYAIHGDTVVPVYPASHGCVRVPMDIANFFHNLVKTPGTEVFVYGTPHYVL